MAERCFLRHSEGAVTIDWVVLTAALLVLSISVLPVLTDELQVLSDAVESEIISAVDDGIRVTE